MNKDYFNDLSIDLCGNGLPIDVDLVHFETIFVFLKNLLFLLKTKFLKFSRTLNI